MQTKFLCGLIHIWTKGEVGAPLNRFKPSSKIFLLTVQRRCFFCGSFMLFLSCFVMLSCTSVCWCLVVTCWERADLLTLVCDVKLWRCHFPIGILGQVWCLIVSIPDLCPLFYVVYILQPCDHLLWKGWKCADVLFMAYRCTCVLDIIVIFSYFFNLWNSRLLAS